jgi:hypothetical protein
VRLESKCLGKAQYRAALAASSGSPVFVRCRVGNSKKSGDGLKFDDRLFPLYCGGGVQETPGSGAWVSVATGGITLPCCLTWWSIMMQLWCWTSHHPHVQDMTGSQWIMTALDTTGS